MVLDYTCNFKVQAFFAYFLNGGGGEVIGLSLAS